MRPEAGSAFTGSWPKDAHPIWSCPVDRVAVFVDGCFWHGCPTHGRKTPWAGPNAALWGQKMRRNAERDQRLTALAEGLGWWVKRVWECEIRKDANQVADQLLRVGG